MATEEEINNDVGYPNGIGLLFVFNLIVGTGALALPKAFQTAGYVLGIIVTTISCLVSYMCATFVIESMAIANAAKVIASRRRLQAVPSSSSSQSPSPSAAIQQQDDPFLISQRIEVSEMANMFLGRVGLLASYITLTVYLFGDLAIYSTTVPKSIMNIICSSTNVSSSSESAYQPCHPGWATLLNRMNVYRIIVVLFVAFVTPLVVIGITRTKYLQLSTSLCRWIAFIAMICLATISLITDGAEGKPPIADFNGFGALFGTTVYAFMCQHSLPGIVTPMRNKRGIALGLLGVYGLVLTFYAALSLTAAFAFEHVFDVYTLNFLHDEVENAKWPTRVLNHFLALFPVFTLTTNYPIVATTLCNNLNVLFDMFGSTLRTINDEEGPLLDDSQSDDGDEDTAISRSIRPSQTNNGFIRSYWKKITIISVVIILPTLIALATDNVLLLASLTGSYPGVGVQFVIPSLLVVYARRYSKRELGTTVPVSASSPFTSMIWPWIMFVWAAFTTLMVTLNFYHLQ